MSSAALLRPLSPGRGVYLPLCSKSNIRRANTVRAPWLIVEHRAHTHITMHTHTLVPVPLLLLLLKSNSSSDISKCLQPCANTREHAPEEMEPDVDFNDTRAKYYGRPVSSSAATLAVFKARHAADSLPSDANIALRGRYFTSAQPTWLAGLPGAGPWKSLSALRRTFRKPRYGHYPKNHLASSSQFYNEANWGRRTNWYVTASLTSRYIDRVSSFFGCVHTTGGNNLTETPSSI